MKSMLYLKSGEKVFHLNYSGFSSAFFSAPVLTFQEIDPSPKSHAPAAPVLNSKAVGHNLRLEENPGKKGVNPASPLFPGGVSGAGIIA